MKKLNDTEFLDLIRLGPLIAIDFVVRDPEGNFLLGKRSNAPARDFWFVQGGRVYKDESLAKAIARISGAEIGVEAHAKDLRFLGVAEHFYEDNFFEEAGVSTHYIVLAYAWDLPQRPEALPRDQHGNYRWMSLAEVLKDPEIHPNARDYFLQYY